ncbi:response regulator transcription factor [Dactylosporangium sp. NPDC051485]|uniref:response regulator transcription factor n=1 Tax=Dactylosporangium sp. NPDC051485 TaxID=3154846 RepID=UPI003426DF01
MTRLLLVQSEPASAVALAGVLRGEAFDVRVAGTGAGALVDLDEHGADVVLLDATLPDLAGAELCRRLRARSRVGILVLGARHSVDDAVLALECGADDYLAKPYGVREFLARIRAIERRCAGGRADRPGVLTAGPLRLDAGAVTASLGGRPLDLPLKEFQLLEALVRNAGRTLGREQLLAAVWGGPGEASNTLSVHVKRLRAKLEADPAAPRHLITVRGVGYRYLP